MSILLISVLMLSYFLLLLVVSRLVSGKENSNEAYFTGNHRAPWMAVAYGMIGTLLSGVTFMSVPGYVRQTQFTYLGVVAGNFIEMQACGSFQGVLVERILSVFT